MNRSTNSSTTSVSTSRTSGSGTSVNRGATTRSSNSNRGTTALPSTTDNRRDMNRSTDATKNLTNDRSSTVGSNIKDSGIGDSKKPNGNKGGDNGKPNDNKARGGKPGNGDNGRTGKPGNIDNGGNGKPGNFDPDHNGKDKGRDRDRNRNGRGRNGNHGYNPNNRFDYSKHHYRDEFSWNYKNHNWSRPLPPPVRVHRPAPWVWHRPVIPVGWRPLATAPIIDRILDIVFGTYYFDSLNHLYCNGYYIDGYADDVIYLRDVPMLGLYWSDVMLNYSSNRFANAQFVYYSDRYDDSRYNIVANKLSRIYGAPVCRDGVTMSWYGSDGIGFVTLSMMNDHTGYYTTMSIGY